MGRGANRFHDSCSACWTCPLDDCFLSRKGSRTMSPCPLIGLGRYAVHSLPGAPFLSGPCRHSSPVETHSSAGLLSGEPPICGGVRSEAGLGPALGRRPPGGDEVDARTDVDGARRVHPACRRSSPALACRLGLRVVAVAALWRAGDLLGDEFGASVCPPGQRRSAHRLAHLLHVTGSEVTCPSGHRAKPHIPASPEVVLAGATTSWTRRPPRGRTWSPFFTTPPSCSGRTPGGRSTGTPERGIPRTLGRRS